VVREGSRSSNSGAILGGPAAIRPRDRSVDAESLMLKVRLPSEFTNARV
jgi:hypothetical protein